MDNKASEKLRFVVAKIGAITSLGGTLDREEIGLLQELLIATADHIDFLNTTIANLAATHVSSHGYRLADFGDDGGDKIGLDALRDPQGYIQQPPGTDGRCTSCGKPVNRKTGLCETEVFAGSVT